MSIWEDLGFATPDISTLSKAYDAQSKRALIDAKRLMNESADELSSTYYGQFGSGGMEDPRARRSMEGLTRGYGEAVGDITANLAEKQAQLQAAAKAYQKQQLNKTISTATTIAGMALPFIPGVGPALGGAMGGLVGATAQTAGAPLAAGQALNVMQKLQLSQILGATGYGVGQLLTGGGPDEMLGSMQGYQKDPWNDQMKQIVMELLKKQLAGNKVEDKTPLVGPMR